MQVWQVHAWGEPDTMTFGEIATPAPGPKQVLIRNRACGLNFFDILQIQGKYQVKPPLPFVPGSEVAGVVEQVGAEVTRLKPGDQVAAIPFGGGLASHTLAAEQVTFPMPPGMSFEEAAAMPIVYQTSFFALRERGQLKPDEWLLVHAAASGVGMSAVQLGKAWGARVIATASSAEKLEFAKKMGADHTISYADASWVDQVRQITGKGADVIYDPVGGDIFDLSSKCIAPFGRILVIGFASGRIPSIAVNRCLLKNMSVVGVLWGNHAAATPRYAADTHAELARMYEAGQIRPAVAAYPLDRAVEALGALSGRRVLGKVVLSQ